MNHILPSHFEANGKEVSGVVESLSTVVVISGDRFVFNFSGGRFTIMRMVIEEKAFLQCTPKQCTKEEEERVKMFVFNMWPVMFSKMTKL